MSNRLLGDPVRPPQAPLMYTVYARDPFKRRITITVYGAITVDDILEYLNRQVAEDTWAYAVLYDTHGGSLPPPEDMRRVINRVRRLTESFGRRGPVAVVSKSPQAALIAREYAAADSGPVTFFRDVAAAEDWVIDQQRLHDPLV